MRPALSTVYTSYMKICLALCTPPPPLSSDATRWMCTRHHRNKLRQYRLCGQGTHSTVRSPRDIKFFLFLKLDITVAIRDRQSLYS